VTSAQRDPLRSPTPPLDPRTFVRWFWQLVKDVVDDYRSDGAGDLAASITFWSVLSVPAAVLALVSGLSSLDSIAGSSVADDVQQRSVEFIANEFVNSETLTSAVNDLFESPNGGVIGIATAAALFTLSRAFAGLIRALDSAYGVENGRRWWHARLVAIGLGAGTLTVVASAAVLLAFLPQLPFHELARWLTVPIVFAALTTWAATLYHLGPNHRTPWRYDLPGAIVTALGWIITTQLFAFYVRVSGSGNQVQSTVGAVLLALTLMWLFSLVMIVGAEVNEIIAQRAGVVQEPRSYRAIARQLQAKVREARNHDGEVADDGTEQSEGSPGV
jgi:membrane protein